MARIQRTNGKICRRNGKLEPCGGCCKCASQGYVQLTAAGIQDGGVDYSSFGPIDTYARSYPEGYFADGDYFVPRMTGDLACEYYKFRNDYGTALSRILGPTGSGTIGCNRDIFFDIRFLGTRTIIQIYLRGARYSTQPPFRDEHYIFFADSDVAPGTVNMDGSVTYANLIESPSTVIAGGIINGENYFYGGTVTLACVDPLNVVADADGGSSDECVQPIDGDPVCQACETYSFADNSTAAIGYDFNDDTTSTNWAGSIDTDFQAITVNAGKVFASFNSWGSGLPPSTGNYAEATFNCTDNEWVVHLYLRDTGSDFIEVTLFGRAGTSGGMTWTNPSDANYGAEDNFGETTITGTIGITVGNACA